MPKKYSLLLLISVLIFSSLACEESSSPIQEPDEFSSFEVVSPQNPLPKNGRILELDSNPPEADDYDRAMDLARELGVESIRLSIFWDDFEVSPGRYDPDPNWLAIANQYYSAQGFKISLVISVLDTTEIRVPADLEGVSFSEPVIAERFNDFLDYVNTQLPDVELVSLAIGNEIDGVLGQDPEAWQAYQVFYEKTSAHAEGLWPRIPISTKVTFSGLFGPMADAAQEIYRDSGVMMTTYYPLKGDFRVQDPQVILEDFQALVNAYPDKEIHITEIGYPTSAANDSSPEKQAEFIQAMFKAWDEHQDQIRVLSYSWLSDLPESSVRELKDYYGLDQQSFGEFLRTLGLRTFPGEGADKIGFEVFRVEAEARGW